MTKEFGLVGLGVMGKSLARNLASKGVRLAVFNRHVAGKEENIAATFLSEFPNELHDTIGFDDLVAFVQCLESPRRIFLMVNAGPPTDAVINDLLPLLSSGDILIDGGNAYYKDTQRRMEALAEHQIHFIGAGVSGGEEGALKGPSIMPGGHPEAYRQVSDYLERIAAKDKVGGSCCAYTGNGGSGHFVKMVHNGIEYAEMELIAEIYFLLRRGAGFSPDNIAAVFEQWSRTEANSYLLEITIDILKKRTEGILLLDTIFDAASSKGTGGWATAAATELGVPNTMIGEALFARYLSSYADERQQAHPVFAVSPGNFAPIAPETLLEAYQIARIVNHHQGIHLIATASDTYHWKLQLPEIARIWTNGCIIRSELMEHLVAVLKETDRILLSDQYASWVSDHQNSLKETIVYAASQHLATPCLSAAFQFLCGYPEVDSPMNLIQAQRDYFGAHTYQRKDQPHGPAYHTNWNIE